MTDIQTLCEIDPKRASFAGFKAGDVLYVSMRCHHCDREADIAVEKDGIKVGVCETHFREQMEALADSDALSNLEEELDIDGPE